MYLKQKFNNKSIFLFLFLLCFSSCFVPEKEAPVYSRKIAEVGKRVIKEDFLRFRMSLELNKFPKDFFKNKKSKILSKNPELKDILDRVLNKIIEDEIILAYGEKNNLLPSDKELVTEFENRKKNHDKKVLNEFLTEQKIPYVKWRRMVENQIKVNFVLQKVFFDQLKISTEEIEKYYRDNIQDYKVDEQIRIRQIVTDSEKKAKDILARLKKKENFAKIAIHHSISPDRSVGGDLGYFSRGSLPKVFDEVCFDLKKGEISQIVKSTYGYHIFKLLDKKPPRTKAVTEVSTSIHQILFQEKLKEAFTKWIKKIKKDIPVKIYEKHLETFVL